MKKLFLACALLASAWMSNTANAQSVGLRLDYYTGAGSFLMYGLDYKHFLNNNIAIEGMATAHFEEGVKLFNISALGEYNYFVNDDVLLYGGAGPELNIASVDFLGETVSDSQFGLGLILGATYNIGPVGISADWHPALNFCEGCGFESGRIGGSIRYNFGDMGGED